MRSLDLPTSITHRVDEIIEVVPSFRLAGGVTLFVGLLRGALGRATRLSDHRGRGRWRSRCTWLQP